MWITKDGHRLSGDEIEVDDAAFIRGAWLLEVCSGDHEILGKEIIDQIEFPSEDIQLYWITRYDGRYIKISRIHVMDYDLPFSGHDYGEAQFMRGYKEKRG